MKDSRDSGIEPLSHVIPCMTSGLTSFKLSKLNIVAVTESLSIYDEECWGSLTSPLVIKGLEPLIQVHFNPEAHSGNQEGPMVKVPVGLSEGKCCIVGCESPTFGRLSSRREFCGLTTFVGSCSGNEIRELKGVSGMEWLLRCNIVNPQIKGGMIIPLGIILRLGCKVIWVWRHNWLGYHDWVGYLWVRVMRMVCCMWS